MKKEDIIALVNKGHVTACGLIESEKVADMPKKTFYDLYVTQTGLADGAKEDAPVKPPTPDPAELENPTDNDKKDESGDNTETNPDQSETEEPRGDNPSTQKAKTKKKATV